jgi:hypothetical protein
MPANPTVYENRKVIYGRLNDENNLQEMAKIWFANPGTSKWLH